MKLLAILGTIVTALIAVSTVGLFIAAIWADNTTRADQLSYHLASTGCACLFAGIFIGGATAFLWSAVMD